MAEIHLQQLAHSYAPDAADPAYALKPIDMVWQDGQTYALLGPSGCGKSTMLNIISGLLKPSHGRVLFDGRDVTALDTGRRNIAQVFQVPVIYTSMTVAENLAFPLLCRKMPQAQIKKRVEDIAERLGLAAQLRRRANALTADQKQLVSLGRGLVREDVSAILLDEPLTVIDPQMKFELRRILKQINEEFRLTMVLVTHDQDEAMTFARTIVVMNHGEVVQSGGPNELFEAPATRHVGYFIGAPAMNFLPATREGNKIRVPGLDLSCRAPRELAEGPLEIGFRPEKVELTGPGQSIRGVVSRIWFEGLEEIVEVTRGGQTIRARLPAGSCRHGSEICLTIPEAGLRLYQNGRIVT
ncbi:ABC transporter ATP-binding protein [Limimaricola soesokkakensis]|uniref:ABC transporter ATP-binding protein n=1 Tax=Limimaricola soesokkakensis TaxID=1343159 RepID=UPI003511D9A2